MTTAAEVISTARAELHYHETGGSHDDGNITKYWAELDPGLQGKPWCAAFVSWVFKHAGHPLPQIDRPYGFVGVQDAYNWARTAHLEDSDGHYQPGDILLMKFSTGWHTGIVVSDDGVNIHTIEGNTSSTDEGDQRNGGCVAEKIRPHGPTVVGVLAASTFLDKGSAPAPHPAPAPAPHPAPAPAPAPSTPSWYHRELSVQSPMLKGDDVKVVQQLVGASPDGVYGNDTAARVRGFQSTHGLTADGVVGPHTAEKLGNAHTAGQVPDWYHRLLKVESPMLRGSDVLAVQRKTGGGSDGIYGPNAANAVRRFQSGHHLPVDGVVGPNTAKELGE